MPFLVQSSIFILNGIHFNDVLNKLVICFNCSCQLCMQILNGTSGNKHSSLKMEGEEMRNLTSCLRLTSFQFSIDLELSSNFRAQLQSKKIVTIVDCDSALQVNDRVQKKRMTWVIYSNERDHINAANEWNIFETQRNLQYPTLLMPRSQYITCFLIRKHKTSCFITLYFRSLRCIPNEELHVELAVFFFNFCSETKVPIQSISILLLAAQISAK